MTVQPTEYRTPDADRLSGYLDVKDPDVWQPFQESNDDHSDALDPGPVAGSAQIIQRDICRLLSDDPQLDAREIVVSVSDGEVILEGTVCSNRDRDHADEIAHLVNGVTRVHNRLEVRRGILSDLVGRLFGPLDLPNHGGGGTKNQP